jgi:uncharacterized protein YdiU (UPF0061 family)
MHGVLNTDNISVLGLTIDYGPFAFMDVWDEGHICSTFITTYHDRAILTSTDHSDPSGLYSYRAQPSRVLWGLDKLVSVISPLIGYEASNPSTPLAPGFSEGKTAEDVEEWTEKGAEVMKGFEEEYYSIEKEAERVGWMKVSPTICFCPGADL